MPTLSALRSDGAPRLIAAQEKALARLDDLREDQGAKPTVTVDLRLSGKEIEDEAGMNRFIKELSVQLLGHLKSGHRIRLK